MPEAEKKSDFTTEQELWLTEIENAEKHQEKWIKRALQVRDRYRDERETGNENDSKFNILWSNVETLRPAVYFQTPKPNVTRRFKDFDSNKPEAVKMNAVTRTASRVLERALSYSIDSYDFDSMMESSVEDYLLPGRAVAKAMYLPEFKQEKIEPDENGTFPDGVKVQADSNGDHFIKKKVGESAECEYYYWEDVIIPKAKTWKHTPWIAFKTYMKRDKLIKFFGENLGKEIKLDYNPKGNSKDAPDTFKEAVIYEIWSKDDNKVIWFNKKHKDILLKKPPPLKLVKFFPISKPMMAVSTNGDNRPIPLYVQYQDQADELDKLTARIDCLTKTVRVIGVFDASAPELEKMLKSTGNKMIPVNNWAMFAENGGIKGAVDWFPVEQVIQVLISLYEARDRVKQTLYEITGIADVVRGASDPRETARAQSIKGNFASLRLEDHQKKVAKFGRDQIRLKAEVIAENFDQETLEKMTGIMLLTVDEVAELQANGADTSMAVTWDDVMGVLRDDMTRQFRIDIETDSTIRPDQEEEKARRVEFLEASGVFLERAITTAQSVPAIAPLLAKMLMFAVRGFKVGRELEESFEEAIQQIASQPPAPQQDPGAAESQARVSKIEQDMQIDAAEHQKSMQQIDQKMELERQEFANKEARENSKAATEILKDHKEIQDNTVQ